MVQLVTLNELPAVFKLLVHDHSSERSAELEYAQLRAINTLSFLENLLGDSPYFASEQLAEIVAGTLVYRMPELGIALTDYPRLMMFGLRTLAHPLPAANRALFRRVE